METGELISRYRKDAGMTLDELSAESGVPRGTLNKIISGDTKSPTLDTMRAIAKALGKHLADFDDTITKNASLWSSEAMQLARDYDGLDVWGRRAVRHTADLEMARVQEQDAKWADDEPIDPGKILPLFRSPAAAGYASPIMGEDYDDYELRPGDPPGAAFAVRVSGDSMEPAFSDGDIAFCDRAPMQDGDIGVFYLGGDMFIKQYHYDPATKMTYLFSLNRKRSDADKLVTVSMQDRFACMGHVIVPRRYLLPGV